LTEEVKIVKRGIGLPRKDQKSKSGDPPRREWVEARSERARDRCPLGPGAGNGAVGL